MFTHTILHNIDNHQLLMLMTTYVYTSLYHVVSCNMLHV